ncbi:MAG: metallophosphoesterase [Clostridiales bacterium]|nr:metallophosphoesterase [Clostridiales bacterium]MCD8369240.1 metallophosphoesterase [Clostridiales bacterium]
MKILALADEESKSLYEYYRPEKLKGVDLIIACGDLRKSYLDFFASVCHAPVFYVLGNHDAWDKTERLPGCVCLEDDIVVYKGIRIMGLGGSMRYQRNARNQYSEAEMARRVRKLWWKLFRMRGFDILVSHSPAKDCNDMEDVPHQGFGCFRKLIENYQPELFIHGHVHATYGSDFRRVDRLGETTVINAYSHYIFEYERGSDVIWSEPAERGY